MPDSRLPAAYAQIDNKAKVNHASSYGQTALMKAAYANALPVIALLVQSKVSGFASRTQKDSSSLSL